jgi:acyl-CoA reductase-like NAD-dependent aldehyde dehydrogenase
MTMGAALIRSVNPATERELAAFEPADDSKIEAVLADAAEAFGSWRKTAIDERALRMAGAASYLRENRPRLAAIITAEMGKPLREAEAEVEKCAWNCQYYAESAAAYLAAESVSSNASESYVQYLPLGTVLAIMPWNFPFWQVFRFAAPALMAGNTAVLKHASNVPQCARAIEEVFRESGFPTGAFQALLIGGAATAKLISDSRIAAVTLTGSEEAGGKVGAAAGSAVKKSVLELGGSDPFIVLEDADLESAVATGVKSRYMNCGQSCIAAKRFIVVSEVFQEFEERFVESARKLRVGDPTNKETQLGPMAREDLRGTVEEQIARSLSQGARLLTGGRRPLTRGYFLEPTVLSHVKRGAAAACEETFGPVAALMRARNGAEAIEIANDSPYGLGANLWTGDIRRARKLSEEIQAGQVFINGMVASDPRLPFGGVKSSGYGRELSLHGIREFVNIQTVWIGPPKET